MWLLSNSVQISFKRYLKQNKIIKETQIYFFRLSINDCRTVIPLRRVDSEDSSLNMSEKISWIIGGLQKQRKYFHLPRSAAWVCRPCAEFSCYSSLLNSSHIKSIIIENGKNHVTIFSRKLWHSWQPFPLLLLPPHRLPQTQPWRLLEPFQRIVLRIYLSENDKIRRILDALQMESRSGQCRQRLLPTNVSVNVIEIKDRCGHSQASVFNFYFLLFFSITSLISSSLFYS